MRYDWERWGTLPPTVGLVALWYTSSISIIFTNKRLLSGHAFAFPFFMTACNNAIVAAVAWAVTRHPRLRQPALSPRTFLRVVLPIGVCTALDIGFSNWSLVFISVAFHTILKGSIPLFVLLCGWLLGLEPCRLLTFTSILLVCAGIGLACSAEVT